MRVILVEITRQFLICNSSEQNLAVRTSTSSPPRQAYDKMTGRKGSSPHPHGREGDRSDETIDLRGQRAVIVEDEGLTQLQLRKILTAEGVDVVGAVAGGEEAVRVALSERPDFLLMDIQLAGVSGLEATRRILERERLCVIMLTAFPPEEHQR